MKSVPQVSFTLLASTRYLAKAYSRKDLHDLASFVLGSERIRGPVELALDMTHPKRIQALNRHFRGVDRSTDVISFRNGSLEGDIAINVRQAELQAKRMGHPVRREIRLLWIHGLLHLLNYTDYEPKPRRRMFKRQNELLRRWEKKVG